MANPNPAPEHRFKKGDPRINRKGRPKNSDQLKDLGLSLLHEPAKDKNGQPVIIDGHVATNLEMILRRMMSDKRQSTELLDRVFGKPITPVDLTSGGKPITGYASVSPDDWDNEPASDGA